MLWWKSWTQNLTNTPPYKQKKAIGSAQWIIQLWSTLRYSWRVCENTGSATTARRHLRVNTSWRMDQVPPQRSVENIPQKYQATMRHQWQPNPWHAMDIRSRRIPSHFLKKIRTHGLRPVWSNNAILKIFCEDDDLSDFHATFIWLPFCYGFSLDRWQQSIQFMLLKLKVPLWEKLRIIQLMEGGFNGGLRYISATKMMTYADMKGTSSDFTYGGRHGRNCHDALLPIQLYNEYHKIIRKPAANIDIDAEACYDRQLRNSISMCMRSLGAPKEAAECQIRTLEKDAT